MVLLKRIGSGGNRYLLVSDERHVAWALEKRFEILDVIRKIKAPGNRSATVSIGIGRGADTLTESEQWGKASFWIWRWDAAATKLR